MRVELLGGRREGCDDCHDDELREERRMRVELLGGRREGCDDWGWRGAPSSPTP
ncbi:unknown [Roseburia sp. CAG:309]|nr:unknown [Roseburia sp. CAG:309]